MSGIYRPYEVKGDPKKNYMKKNNFGVLLIDNQVKGGNEGRCVVVVEPEFNIMTAVVSS